MGFFIFMAKKQITLPHNYRPREYQWSFFEAMATGIKRAVCVWHRRAGKDKTFLNFMIKEMPKRVGAYYYFLPTYRQGKQILWDGIDRDGFKYMHHFPKEIIKRKHETEMKIELTTGSIFQIIGTDNIDAIMGTNPVGCVFSEYSLQNRDAWDFISPILAENDGWAVFNFTPRGMNHGWEIYTKADENDDWFCEKLTVEDTVRPDGSRVITEETIERERARGMSESMIRQEYYCDFGASSDDKLIPFEIIRKAAGRSIHESNYHHAPRILGVDCARFGDDSSTIIKRQGLAAWDLKAYTNIDTVTFANRVAHEINTWKPDAVFIDEVGLGGDPVDLLRSYKFNIIAVNAGRTATDPVRYKNKRAEMWWKCKEWLESGGCIPDDRALKEQLSMQPYEFDASQKLVLWSKEKMKKDLGIPSPDKAEALVHTFYQDILMQREDKHMSRVFGAGIQPKAQTEYDIFNI
jgi:hypothetical protein